MMSITIRQWHSYLAIFIAPSVLFFACTGALQLFSLHEAHGDYRPWPFVEKLGMLHKDQIFAQRTRAAPPGVSPVTRQPPLAGAVAAPDSAPPHEAALSTRLFKWFFLVVALGLIASTTLGLWIGLTRPRQGKLGFLLLAAGVLVPGVLFVF